MSKLATTLGELKKSGYTSRSIKEELRKNLITHLKNGTNAFSNIFGYDETVIPELERAILAGHHINLLGLRGQAKTRIARLLVNLLDEYIPVIAGSELNDDPFNPVSWFGKNTIAEQGDDTAITWLHRSERYTEKLATPDVSVADLIGDIDPIKAANLKLSYSDPRVIHYGLIPRSNRCLFVINELPDLQPRIQVALFNILQESDIQIRGFKFQLPLDIQFVFTANPEDYTSRGSIITPLKDRIGSQIITHYPKTREIGKQITAQEASKNTKNDKIHVPELAKDIIEQVAIEARNSEYVDHKSGVSARLTISAYENVLSAAERRLWKNNEANTTVRMGDIAAMVPAITGKVELVYEGEQEGAQIVAQNLIGKAIRTLFLQYFPNPEKTKKEKANDIYRKLSQFFASGNTVELLNDLPDEKYKSILTNITGLDEVMRGCTYGEVQSADLLFFKEFTLHGLAETSVIAKKAMHSSVAFEDLLSSMINFDGLSDENLDIDDEEDQGNKPRW
jgi:magnesium chelatase subunit I